MEGLEASVVSMSDVLSSTSTFRFDPEYFQKQHLFDEELVRQKADSFQTPRDLRIVVDASAFYPSIEEFYDTGDLPFYRVGDVDGMVEVERATKIPAHLCCQFPTLKRVKHGDILLTKGGAIDRAGYVIQEGAVSRDLIFLKTSRLPEPNRLLLFAYFRTAFFRRMLLRSSSQTAQPHLTITLVRELPIFLGSSCISEAVASVVTSAYRHADAAAKCLQKAENTLLEALGLADWTPPEPVAYQQTARALRAAKRMDAEYFDPRHLYAEQVIASGAFETIEDLSRFVSSGPAWPSSSFTTYDDLSGKPFVRIRNCKPGVIETKYLDRLGRDEIEKFNVEMGKPGDLAIGMDGIKWFYAGVLDGDAYINQRVGWVRLDEVAPAPSYVQLVINSPLGQAQLLRRMTIAQTVGHITLSDIRALKIPRLPTNDEEKITRLLQSGMEAEAQADQLLEAAKRAVEIAIEDGEGAAMAFLDQAEGAG